MIRRFLIACGCGVLVFGCSAFERRPELCTEVKGTVSYNAKAGEAAQEQTVRFTSEHCAASGPSRR